MKIIITEQQLKSLHHLVSINGVDFYSGLQHIEENKKIGYEMLIKESRKFSSSEELLRSGGFSGVALDLSAFGFTEDSVKKISPSKLKVKWKDDMENVLREVKDSGLSPINWSKKINLNEPIDVSFNGSKFFIEDGHHRYFAAKTLKKILNCNLEIKANPFLYLNNSDYDMFHREFYNKHVLSEQSRSDYLKWKRKNVTIRGIKELGKDNGGMGRFGSGLYTAFLGNRSMAKEYGKVYFVVNAIPKHPKVVQYANDAEIFLQNMINHWCKENNNGEYDPNYFYNKTNVPDEMEKLGYDGLVVKGREMVNYKPGDNIKYFESESQLEDYYFSLIQ